MGERSWVPGGRNRRCTGSSLRWCVDSGRGDVGRWRAAGAVVVAAHAVLYSPLEKEVTVLAPDLQAAHITF